MYYFPRAAIINHHKIRSLTKQKLILLEFYRVEVQNQGVCRAMLLLNPFLFLPSFWWLLTIFDVPWLVAASLQSLPLSPHGLLPCVCFCVFSSLLIRTPIFGFRAHSVPVWPHLNMINYFYKTLFPNKFTFWGTGGHECWGETLLNPIQVDTTSSTGTGSQWPSATPGINALVVVL